jgi:hypothetical protein
MLAGIASRNVDPVTLTLLGVEVICSGITGACLPPFFIKDKYTNQDMYKFVSSTSATIAAFASFLHILCTDSHPYMHAGILLTAAAISAAIRTRFTVAGKQVPEFHMQLAEARIKAAAKHKAQAGKAGAELRDIAQGLEGNVAEIRQLILN